MHALLASLGTEFNLRFALQDCLGVGDTEYDHDNKAVSDDRISWVLDGPLSSTIFRLQSFKPRASSGKDQ